MKISISIFLQQECGGWKNIFYRILDSRVEENYMSIKQNLSRNLKLKIDRNKKKIVKTHIVMSGQELINKSSFSIREEIKNIIQYELESKIEIIVNEWIDHV